MSDPIVDEVEQAYRELHPPKDDDQYRMKQYTFFINLNSFPIYQETVMASSFTQDDLKDIYTGYLAKLERIVRYFCVSRGCEPFSLLTVKNIFFNIHEANTTGTVEVNIHERLDKVMLNELAKLIAKQM